MNLSPVLRALTAIAFAISLSPGQAVESEQSFDVVVIGGGLMGSSTAWQLARAGQNVLLLEKQAWPYNEGSSLGEARIARSLGGQGDIWSYLHNRTVAEAELLIQFLNQHESGHSMSDIYTTSPVSYARHITHANRIESIVEGQQDEFLYAKTPEQAQDLFGLTLPSDFILYREYKQHSGTINPNALIERLHKGIRFAGGTVAYQQRVNELSRRGAAYSIVVADSVTGEQQTIHAQKVVSAAGPYTGQLLKDIAPYFDALIQPRRVFLGFFTLSEEFYSRLTGEERARLKELYPAINSTVPGRESSFFTMLEGQTEQGVPIIKIGGHFQRTPITDLDEVWRLNLTPDEIEWSKQSSLRHLSLLGVDIAPDDLIFVRGYSCVYSLTESEDPYVTTTINAQGVQDPNLVVVAGLSGVGGKGAMAYGLMAANLLLQSTEQDPVYQMAAAAFGFERLLRDLQ